MRQVAHLNAGIDKEYKSHNQESRIERFKNAGAEPKMPNLGSESYLIDLLFQIGTSKQGASGLIPIEWVDLKAFCDVTGTQLTREEALIIKSLSADFVSQINASRNPSEPPPFQDGALKTAAKVLFANHPRYANK